MTTIGLWVLVVLVAAATTWRAGTYLAVTAPLTRANHRGLQVPTAAGIAIILGLLASSAVVRVLLSITPESPRLLAAALVAPSILAAALGFGLLGLWDDIAGTSGQRGWSAHLRALGRAEVTSGALKLLAGGMLAIVLSPGRDLWVLFAQAAVIALSANLFNLLDIRPGRSPKVMLIAIAALLIAGGPVSLHLAALAGAVAAFLPLDLRERAMLGDTGANAIGGVIGYSIVITASITWLVVALGLLVLLNVAGQRPGLSTLIDATPPLRAFDRAGRAH